MQTDATCNKLHLYLTYEQYTIQPGAIFIVSCYTFFVHIPGPIHF